MDIMRPKLTQIGRMCFRRLDLPIDDIIDVYSSDCDDICEEINDKKESIDSEINELNDKKSIDVLETIEFEDTATDDTIEDISDGNGNRFRSKLKIGKYFHKFIVGEYGKTLKRLENQTYTRIDVPNHNDLTSAIVITGRVKDDVKNAVKKIEESIVYWRQRSDFSHFVSIPFNQNSIRERFNSFKNEILNDSKINKAIEESLFQNSHKLHLTIAPILLTDQNEKTIASQILEDCDQNFIKPLTKGQKIRVKLEGIDYMNDDPTQVDVIYAKVVDLTENQCLQSIINDLFDRFEKSQLMTRSHQFDRVNNEQRVKPHITLINTKFKSINRQNPRITRVRKRESFDATHILKRFGDYSFGEVTIETIEISIRHSNYGKVGYYFHTHRIEL